MADPIFWLGLSLFLVALALTAVLAIALPAVWELARAARSAQRLLDTLNRDLPPTLEALRLTGLELTELSEDVSEGVQSASKVVQRVDQSVDSVRQQAGRVHQGTRSVFVGVRAAWQAFFQPEADTEPDESQASHIAPRREGYDPHGDVDEAPFLPIQSPPPEPDWEAETEAHSPATHPDLNDTDVNDDDPHQDIPRSRLEQREGQESGN